MEIITRARQYRSTERTCPTCGKTFMRPPSRPGNYCSTDCRHKGRITATQRTCPICGKVFVRQNWQEGNYCSYSCASNAKAKPVAERLASKLDKSGGHNSCWLWQGWYSKQTGYAKITIKNVGHFAHRVAYELANGPIPKGVWVLHNCPSGDNPLCCNPAHLWLGTAAENSADMIAKGRAAWQNGKHHNQYI